MTDIEAIDIFYKHILICQEATGNFIKELKDIPEAVSIAEQINRRFQNNLEYLQALKQLIHSRDLAQKTETQTK